MPTRYPREQMHRIKYTKLTPEQIAGKLAAAANGPASASPLSDTLARTSLKIVLDGGPALSYRFADAKRLSFTEGDTAAVDAGYGALTLDRLVLFSHLVPRTQRGYTVVIDRDSNLATVFELWFSGYEDNREVQRQVSFGYVEQGGKPAPSARHGITNRIEGKGARLPCIVHFETAIGPNCPLVEMARLQGGGIVRRAESGLLVNEAACS